MKTTLGTIHAAVPTINKILSQDIPIIPAFRIREIADKCTPIIQRLDDTRVNLIHKLADGGSEVPEEKIVEFQEQIAELMAEEIELDVEPVNIKSIENVTISPNEAALIRWMVVY